MPSNTTELFGLLSFLAILALFLHSVWKFSRRFPNVDDRAPTGVEGGLLFLMTGSVTLTVWYAAALANLGSYLTQTKAVSWDTWISSALPEITAMFGFLWASLRIVTGRKPRVKWEVALSLLSAGPVATAVLHAQHRAVDWEFEACILAFTLWGTWYVLRSERARHVFG